MAKLIIKSIILVILISVILTVLSPYFIPKWIDGNVNNGKTYMTRTTDGFFALPEDSVDVLFIGSSQILRGISPNVLKDEFGISSYLRATVVQPPQASYYYLKNALKTQSPKTVIVDFSMLYTEYQYEEHEAYVRYAFDTMPLDLDKTIAIANTTKNSDKLKMIDYVFPILYYHDRWNELSEVDKTYPRSKDRTDPAMGSILLDDIAPQEFVPYKGGAQSGEEYCENSLYWYQKMIDFCKKEDIRFIMIRTPRMDWSESYNASDTALAEKNGIEFIDFNLEEYYESADLSADTDFCDRNHLTRSGAEKISRAIGEYLSK